MMREGMASFTVANKLASYVDPLEQITRGLTRFKPLPHLYYARSRPLPAQPAEPLEQLGGQTEGSVGQKRKRRKKEYVPKEKEQQAIQRHEGLRSFLCAAHEAFLAQLHASRGEQGSVHLLPELRGGADTQGSETEGGERQSAAEKTKEVQLKEIGTTWQADLCELEMPRLGGQSDEGAGPVALPLFNSVVENPSEQEVVASALGQLVLLPPRARFLMSDIDRMAPLIPGASEEGYNLVVVDPPWENRSVKRRASYATLPNRRLLGLPIRQLAHRDGALVALWVTNREKLRGFVEGELLPAWGVRLAATWLWLKVAANGSMLSALDCTHHRPYEVLLLGYLPPGTARHPEQREGGNGAADEAAEDGREGWGPERRPPQNHVLISVPGEHSRKPPIAQLLAPYVPGTSTVRPLEMFARELLPGWTSWGNEPLHFQQIKYFTAK